MGIVPDYATKLPEERERSACTWRPDARRHLQSLPDSSPAMSSASDWEHAACDLRPGDGAGSPQTPAIAAVSVPISQVEPGREVVAGPQRIDDAVRGSDRRRRPRVMNSSGCWLARSCRAVDSVVEEERAADGRPRRGQVDAPRLAAAGRDVAVHRREHISDQRRRPRRSPDCRSMLAPCAIRCRQNVGNTRQLSYEVDELAMRLLRPRCRRSRHPHRLWPWRNSHAEDVDGSRPPSPTGSGAGTSTTMKIAQYRASI